MVINPLFQTDIPSSCYFAWRQGNILEVIARSQESRQCTPASSSVKTCQVGKTLPFRKISNQWEWWWFYTTFICLWFSFCRLPLKNSASRLLKSYWIVMLSSNRYDHNFSFGRKKQRTKTCWEHSENCSSNKMSSRKFLFSESYKCE